MKNQNRVIAHSPHDIVQQTTRALFRDYDLSPDYIIGLIGERGSGKSLGGSNIAIRDWAFNKQSLWSNMEIKVSVEIDNAYARGFECEGGCVPYEAEHLERQAFLSLDSRYEGGCFFFDEFNLEYGEARRSQANVNLMTDRAIQQLRKLQSGLIYTVLNELYVDSRIRDNTDLFIQCEDIAYKPENRVNHMRQGIQFEWLLYPMTARVFGTGLTYAEMGHPIGPIPITLGHLWGSIDTYERQAAGSLTYKTSTVKGKELLAINPGEDPKVLTERDIWDWLKQRLNKFWENHIQDGDPIVISSQELREELNVERDQWGYVSDNLYQIVPGTTSTKGKGRTKAKLFYIPNRLPMFVK